MIGPHASTPAFVVFVDGIPPSPNELRRAHWSLRADQAEQFRTAARLLALDKINREGWSAPARATIELVAICPTALRRDPDNFVAACKPIIDGLVDAGVLADDSFEVVTSLSVRQERGGKRAGVRVTVTAA